jgi:hypothetical protein
VAKKIEPDASDPHQDRIWNVKKWVSSMLLLGIKLPPLLQSEH